MDHTRPVRVNLVLQAQQELAEGSTTFEPKYRAAKGSRATMTSATHIKLRAKVEGRAAEAAQVEAKMAQAARAEEARVAQELAGRASATASDPGTEQLRQDLVNPFETPGSVEEALTPECRVKPLVPVVLPPNIEGGELDVETQEDFDRLDNDILA